MKVLIDIPKYAYERIREYYEKNDTVESTYGYIYHGTPIPDNATCEDVINLITDNGLPMGADECNYFMVISKKWLQSPYQKGGKE
jgi:hypothetical protein